LGWWTLRKPFQERDRQLVERPAAPVGFGLPGEPGVQGAGSSEETVDDVVRQSHGAPQEIEVLLGPGGLLLHCRHQLLGSLLQQRERPGRYTFRTYGVEHAQVAQLEDRVREDLWVVEGVGEPAPHQVGRERLLVAEGEGQEQSDGHPPQLPFRGRLIPAVGRRRRATGWGPGGRCRSEQRPPVAAAEFGEQLVDLRCLAGQDVGELVEQDGPDGRLRLRQQSLTSYAKAALVGGLDEVKGLGGQEPVGLVQVGEPLVERGTDHRRVGTGLPIRPGEERPEAPDGRRDQGR
jgi:hypothetical protein